LKVQILPSFLQDLRDADDPRFVRRVIDQVVQEGGSFKRDPNDHRYHGVKDAWIRYVTGGKTAYRLIYLQVDDTVFLYRVGFHSVEDRLASPKALDGYPIGSIDVKAETPAFKSSLSGEFLKTSQPLMLSKVLASMYHVAHREIWLVSPYLSSQLLDRHSAFGMFLDRAMEDGAAIGLVTRLSDRHPYSFYSSLEERGILVYLHAKLHAKLYVFELNKDSLCKFNRNTISTAILGSANLTESGLSLSEPNGNEELCYRVPEHQFDEAKQHAIWLANQSQDLQSVIAKLGRRF